MKKNKKKYNTGGQVAGGLAATATSFIPGVGPALAPVAGSLVSQAFQKEQRKPVNTSMGYMKYGGKLKYPMGGQLPSASTPIGADAHRYEGPSHEQGGIPIDDQGTPTDPALATGEVEGGETIQGDFIFSDELMVPGEDISFAEMHELLLQQGAPEEQIEQLAQMQEQVKQEQGIESPEGEQFMKKGGKLPKYRYGSDQYNIRSQRKGENIIMNNRPSVAPVTSTAPTPQKTAATASTPQENIINRQSNEEGRDWGQIAQRFAPSITKLATATFAPRPKRTRAMTQTNVRPETGVFNDARRKLASGMRANPNQGAYAQYMQGVNELAGQEAQHRTQIESQNRHADMRTQQFNIQNEARDEEVRAQDTGARIGLVDSAIQQPLTAARMDKQGKESQIATILTSADQIEHAPERDQAIFARLTAMGLSRAEALKYVSNPNHIKN